MPCNASAIAQAIISNEFLQAVMGEQMFRIVEGFASQPKVPGLVKTEWDITEYRHDDRSGEVYVEFRNGLNMSITTEGRIICLGRSSQEQLKLAESFKLYLTQAAGLLLQEKVQKTIARKFAVTATKRIGPVLKIEVEV